MRSFKLKRCDTMKPGYISKLMYHLPALLLMAFIQTLVCLKGMVTLMFFYYYYLLFQAIQNPNNEALQDQAWAAVVPLVGKLKHFYEFSQRLGTVTLRPHHAPYLLHAPHSRICGTMIKLFLHDPVIYIKQLE